MEVKDKPHVVSPLGVVPKAGSSKLRLIWDGRFVNKYVNIPDLTYESLSFLKEVLLPNDYMFSIDLKSGYHHLDIHPDCWKFLGFEWHGKYYVYTQLPFGLAPACWAFSKLTREVLSYFRRKGIACTGYIDDSLYAHSKADTLQDQQRIILHTWQDLGFIVNIEKSQTTVGRRLRYLGMWVDTEKGTFFVPEEKRERFIKACQEILDHPEQLVPARTLASIKGQLLSMNWAFGGVVVRIFSRELDLNVIPAIPSWKDSVLPTKGCLETLEFWVRTFQLFDGSASIWPPTTFQTVIHTDAAGADEASLGGWGAWATEDREDTQQRIAKGRWASDDSSESSTFQELLAILLSLRAFHGPTKELAHQNVMIFTDSLNAALSINKGSSRAPKCLKIRQEIFWFCLTEKIHLEATWIPREENEFADQLSKQKDEGDIMLNPRLFKSLEDRWGHFGVDLFADDLNAQTKVFYSRFFSPNAQGVNAFSFNWQTVFSWANPPFALLLRTLEYAKLCRARLALLVPAWTWAPWWRKLVTPEGTAFNNFVREVVTLPNVVDLFLSPTTGRPLGRRKWATLVLLLDFSSIFQTVIPVPPALHPSR